MNKIYPAICLLVITLIAVGCKGKPEGDKSSQPVETEESFTSGKDNEQALFALSENGKYEQVKQLLNKKTNPNARDQDGRTPIMLASFNGHTHVVELLLDLGAEVDTRDFSGRTALIYASTGPFPKTVELLLEQGANPNTIDDVEHFTSLMHAAAEGQLEVVKILLAHRADPALKDVDGDTAESFARKNGHTAVVDLLHGK